MRRPVQLPPVPEGKEVEALERLASQMRADIRAAEQRLAGVELAIKIVKDNPGAGR